MYDFTIIFCALMPFDEYKSIAGATQGLFKDNSSRFIAFAYPVESVEEVKPIVDKLKTQYHDARHHCYAYRIGYKKELFRANDDGEPSGSAGRQILSTIDSMDLSDVLVVVVRYFGGIKLGIPGLIRAYRTSTEDALSKAEIYTKIASETVTVRFDYLKMNDVMRIIKEIGAKIVDQEMDLECTYSVRVRLSDLETFNEKISKIVKL